MKNKRYLKSSKNLSVYVSFNESSIILVSCFLPFNFYFTIQDFSIIKATRNTSLRSCCFKSLYCILLVMLIIVLHMPSYAIIIAFEVIPSWYTLICSSHDSYQSHAPLISLSSSTMPLLYFEKFNLSSLFLCLGSFSRVTLPSLSKDKQLPILLFIVLMMS